MKHVFFRALVYSLLRFLALFVILLALQWIDFSPLPVWTTAAIAYLAHFAVTYVAARMVFHVHEPSVGDMVAVMILFVVMEFVFEALAIILFTVAQWSDLLRQYSWVSVAIVALYLLAVYAAAAQSRRHHVKAILPEGLEG